MGSSPLHFQEMGSSYLHFQEMGFPHLHFQEMGSPHLHSQEMGSPHFHFLETGSLPSEGFFKLVFNQMLVEMLMHSYRLANLKLFLWGRGLVKGFHVSAALPILQINVRCARKLWNQVTRTGGLTQASLYAIMDPLEGATFL